MRGYYDFGPGHHRNAPAAPAVPQTYETVGDLPVGAVFSLSNSPADGQWFTVVSHEGGGESTVSKWGVLPSDKKITTVGSNVAVWRRR